VPFGLTEAVALPHGMWEPERKMVRLLSFWDSPLPADFGMSPLSSMNSGSAGVESSFIFLRYEPRAYIRRSFEAANVRFR
jgi:hypothetical protein